MRKRVKYLPTGLFVADELVSAATRDARCFVDRERGEKIYFPRVHIRTDHNLMGEEILIPDWMMRSRNRTFSLSQKEWMEWKRK